MFSERADDPQILTGSRISKGATFAFFFLQIFGGHFGIPIILATFLFARVRRHPLVVNFLVIWAIYSTSFCLLLYTGYQFSSNTPHVLCVIQAALIHGVSLMAPIATFVFIFNLWSCTRMTTVLSDEDEDAAPVGKSMSRRDRVLLAAPYAGFFICVLVILAVPDPNGHIIFREEGFLYCTIQSPATRIIPLLGGSLMILALILDGIVMLRLWRMCKSYDELEMKRDFSMSIIVRVMLVSLCSFIALIALGMSILHDAVLVAPHIIQAILPTVAFIVFGTQTDLLEAWGLVRLWNRLRQFIRSLSNQQHIAREHDVC